MSSRRFRGIAKILLIGCLWISTSAVACGQGWRLGGQTGDSDWGETPVVLPIRADLAPGSYALEGNSSSASRPAVVFEDGDQRCLAAILPAQPARRPFSYELKRQGSTDQASQGGIRFRPAGSNLDVMLDDRLLTTYQPVSGSKPILFPVIGPTGDAFTRAFPMVDVPGEDRDHPHQRSFWFTHGDVNKIDFWAEDRPGTAPEKRTKGSIRELEHQVIVEGPVLARLRTKDEWLAPDGRRVCRDRRTVTFYRTQAVRIIDFEIAIEATDGPLTFGDTKEGMFGLRLASSMNVRRKKGGKITNAEGLTDDKAWGKASPWVDYVGPVNDKTVGVAILNHPDSLRFPTTWHVRDYGLFAANPFGWKDFGRSDRGDYTVPAGESVRFAYRIILHAGDTASFGPSGYFEAYARPPARLAREN
jgi:hypothetical protein